MKILIAVLSIFVFFKTLYYGIYEYKKNNNKIAGILIMVIAVIVLVVPTVMVNLRIDLAR